MNFAEAFEKEMNDQVAYLRREYNRCPSCGAQIGDNCTCPPPVPPTRWQRYKWTWNEWQQSKREALALVIAPWMRGRWDD